MIKDIAIKGTGISFRSPHWRSIMETKPDIPWMEVLADNFMGAGGMPAYQLDTIAEHYPLTLHSVGISIGAYVPLDFDYLAELKTLKKRTGAIWLSDHLCFTHAQGIYSHDLLPLPYTDESLKHVVERLNIVQDFFGEALLIENPSSYIDSQSNTFSEAEFLQQLVRESNCQLLLDVNNIYVSQYNRHLKCDDYLYHIPWDKVAEIHLAGFEQQEDILIDAHNNPVSEPVWQLFKQVLEVLPNVPALVEWDNDLPPLTDLIGEQQKAESIRQQILSHRQISTFEKEFVAPVKARKEASTHTLLDLKHWQTQLISAINGDTLANKKMQGHLRKTPMISNDDALGIYQNNYQGTLINALEQCYKVCRQLIGNDAFRQQAVRYIALSPSTNQDINQYGSRFSAHLMALTNNDPRYAALPYLPDMAKYEYLYQSIYYAPEPPANDLPGANDVGSNLLTVTLNQHCRIFTSPCPISKIWHIHERGNLEKLQLLNIEHTEYCLLYRNHDLQLVPLPIAQIQFQLMQKLAATAIPLSHFVTLSESLGLEPDTLLPQWISAGWVALAETLALKTPSIETSSLKTETPFSCIQK